MLSMWPHQLPRAEAVAGNQTLCFASPLQFSLVPQGWFCRALSSSRMRAGAELAPFRTGLGCPCNAIAVSMPAWLWAVCTQLSRSFLPLPFCLPLGLQAWRSPADKDTGPVCLLTCCGITKS